MKILELRILPPLAIARLGSSPNPLDNFEQELPADGLGFRSVKPAETLYVDEKSGEIRDAHTPDVIVFRDGEHIRPVAPFLEVYARTDDDTLVPLTRDLLRANGIKPEDVKWTVEVGNIKAFRRTRNPGDKALAKVSFCDHAVHRLDATADNFLPKKVLPLGSVRYITPNDRFPGIRLRFTPAAGLVYGASDHRFEMEHGQKVSKPDKIIGDRIIYNKKKKTEGKQSWYGYLDPGTSTFTDPLVTNPGAIHAGYDAGDGQVSWGYLDDECDGIVTVELKLDQHRTLSAFSRIGAGPPNFAPDGLPVRTINDELLQALLGKDVAAPDASLSAAEDTLRRALETVRLMNVAVMNGNTIAGRSDAASTMVRQDSADTHRMFAPVMASSIVDTASVLALHQAVLTALRAGTAPWFADVLRKPEEIGDLSDAGRRKMPALMRGAEGRHLALTRRQIDMVRRIAIEGPFRPSPRSSPPSDIASSEPPKIEARNIAAQLAHLGRGNSPMSHPMSAISNCFPGLEFDFRNIWRRIFVGIVLVENNNYVADCEDRKYADLVNCRLLAIDDKPVMTKAMGVVRPGDSPKILPGEANRQAVAFMEWSNNIAMILDKQGQNVSCIFTKEESPFEVLYDKYDDKTMKKQQLEVRRIFEHVTFGGTLEPLPVLARALAQPGELTQGLCSPWQNDYRECACYYWAASRPDYVNVQMAEDGTSRGDMWMQKARHTGDYVLDDRSDSRLISYDDLFEKWEKVLHFQIGGKDATEAGPASTAPRARRDGEA
jgi:hypothetical protein